MSEKPLSKKELEALKHIRNRILHGQEPPSVRELQTLLGYDSPNSAAYILARLMKRRYIQRRRDKKLQLLKGASENSTRERTVQVPLVGSAPCGLPMLAEQNIEAMIPVSARLARPPHRYFLLRAIGTSMNRAGIQNGDLVLVRQQSAAESGNIVVALIDDEATIKVFKPSGDVIKLLPKSSSDEHKPIIMNTNFRVQGVVQATIRDWDERG